MLMILPEPERLHPVAAEANDEAVSVEPPLTAIELDELELSKIPHPVAVNFDAPDMVRVPDVHTHVVLVIPPPAIAVADTGTVAIPWANAPRKVVWMGMLTVACT